MRLSGEPARSSSARKLSGAAFSLSAAAHGARFLAYAVLMVGLARLWPPEVFGAFAFHNAAASILGLAAGWGLSLKVTRDVALSPGTAGAALGSALAAQICLAPLCMIAAWGLWLADLPVALDVILPLLGAFLCLNGAETVAAACRGFGRFDAEATISAVGNGVFFLAGLGAMVVWPTPAAVALALLVGRAFHAAAALWMAHRLGILISATSPAPVAALRTGAVFAGESLAAGLFLQIDTVVVALLLGDAAAGAYQAGIRFIVIALLFAQAMAGLFLPALTARLRDAAAFASTARRALLAFGSYGLAGFLFLLLWGGELALLLYGNGYQATAALAPLFGGLVLVRCVAAGAAVVLAAAGRQAWRFGAILTALAVYLMAAWAVGDDHGIEGLVWANLGSLATLALLYLAKARRWVRPRGAPAPRNWVSGHTSGGS